MTYAREMAERCARALDEPLRAQFTLPPSVTAPIYIESTIEAVIERCAQVIKDARGECNDEELMRRIRALAAPPAGVGAEPCRTCKGQHAQFCSACMGSGRAPAGTGGRR